MTVLLRSRRYGHSCRVSGHGSRCEVSAERSLWSRAREKRLWRREEVSMVSDWCKTCGLTKTNCTCGNSKGW